jgi:hypothetical protein
MFTIACKPKTSTSARTAFLEYNWFARAANYEGDLMTDDDFSGSGTFNQTMWIRGNVFIQNANPGNHSQVLVVFNDTGLANENMSIQVLQNTYIGNGKANNAGGGAAFVHLSNAEGTAMSATISNNIISGTTLPVLIENTSAGAAAGTNNWLKTGVTPGPLANSVFSAGPGFANSAAFDYTLLPGSAPIGQAAALDSGLPPTREYFQIRRSPENIASAPQRRIWAPSKARRAARSLDLTTPFHYPSSRPPSSVRKSS